MAGYRVTEQLASEMMSAAETLYANDLRPVAVLCTDRIGTPRLVRFPPTTNEDVKRLIASLPEGEPSHAR